MNTKLITMPDKLKVIKEIKTILDQDCGDPAEEMIKYGEAIAAIGKAIKGMSIAEARATMTAVEAMTITSRP